MVNSFRGLFVQKMTHQRGPQLTLMPGTSIIYPKCLQ